MKWWLIGFVAGAVVLAALVFPRTSEQAPGGSTKASATIELEGEVRALRAEVEALRRQVRAPREYIVTSAAATPAPVAAQPLEPPVPETLEDLDEKAKEQQREVLTSLEARLASERVDGEWSRDTVRQIRDVVAANLPGSRVELAECGASLCRVALSHESRAAQSMVGNTLPSFEPFRWGVAYDVDSESEPPKTTLFLLRPGHSFDKEANGL